MYSDYIKTRRFVCCDDLLCVCVLEVQSVSCEIVVVFFTSTFITKLKMCHKKKHIFDFDFSCDHMTFPFIYLFICFV